MEESCLDLYPVSVFTLLKACFVFMLLNSCSDLSLYFSLALIVSFLICLLMVLTHSQCQNASRFSFRLCLIWAVIPSLEFVYFFKGLVGMVMATKNLI